MTMATERIGEIREQIEELIPEDIKPEIIRLLDEYDAMFLELQRRS